jgi:hypothetical protein
MGAWQHHCEYIEGVQTEIISKAALPYENLAVLCEPC